jgi:diguanylate cyclase (GGDEF)-like protein
MSEIVDRLADLTGFRDRDVLDVTLVGALRDLLRPTSVAVYRCVGEFGDERWLTRAHLRDGEVTAAVDSLWSQLDSLPALASNPLRHLCLQEQAAVHEPGPPARCYFPLSTDAEPIGVLEIERVEPLSAAEQRLVAGVTRIYRNFLSLLDYSERDTLTGLLNRKTFDESFMKSTAGRPEARSGQAESEARRGDGGYWLGVADIDHFKRVNDTFGHLIGDEVLLLLARLMRSSFRVHDRLYRFGGEEFVVLVRCGSAADAAAAFERLRVNVEAFSFPQVGRISVSVGFTRVKPADTPAGAFARADRAVYHAKHHGRNQVCSHADLIERGLLEDVDKVGDVELF